MRREKLLGVSRSNSLNDPYEARVGVSHAVALSSGTAALALGLKVLSIKCGDEVILPTYVCRSVLEAVKASGATPILCDVSPTGVIDSNTVKPHMTRRTRAIIAVHNIGPCLCDITSLKHLGVYVIEDACQAFGLRVKGQFAGGFGDLGIYSFHATKCLTTGEGGMLVTANDRLGCRARNLSSDASKSLREVFSPLSDLQAALGLAQLKRYPEFLERRRLIRAEYLRAFDEFGLAGKELNVSDELFRFVVTVPRQSFEVVRHKFARRGVTVRKGVDELLHRLMGLSDRDFPFATELFEQTISVPFYPSLTILEIKKITDSLALVSDDNRY